MEKKHRRTLRKAVSPPVRRKPALIEFLSNPGRAVAPEVELDLRRARPDENARESEVYSAKELLALTREHGAVLTEADARAIDELNATDQPPSIP